MLSPGKGKFLPQGNHLNKLCSSSLNEASSGHFEIRHEDFSKLCWMFEVFVMLVKCSVQIRFLKRFERTWPKYQWSVDFDSNRQEGVDFYRNMLPLLLSFFLRCDLYIWPWHLHMTLTLVPNKNSYHKEYKCDILKLYHLPFKGHGQI